ncbi:MAG: LysR substrate-binding domain-containing protein [Polaromonas sp.]|nr:LysR substrate-binding domain-containing protein [Polaromonas sp.]
MKIHHLRNLVAVADAQSIRGAARAQGLAQPAITRGLRDLEKELGVPLLERHGKGVSLTAYGQAFVVRARSVLLDMERGRQEIEQLKGMGTGRVSAGLSGTVFLSLVPEVYRAFRKTYPDVLLSFTEGLFPGLEAALRNGSLDFYIGPRPVGELDQSYTVQLLFRNQRVVACRKGHPLGSARSLRDLSDAHWIMTGLREPVEIEFEEQFAVHGLPAPKAVTQTLTTLPTIALLTATDALAFLPRQWIDSPIFGGALQEVPVQEALNGPDIVFIKRSGLPLTPLAEVLATLFERAAGAAAAVTHTG